MSLFNNSHSSDLIIKLDSKASSRASVSAESLLLTTLFNLFNFHAIGASLPLPHRTGRLQSHLVKIHSLDLQKRQH